MKKLNRGTWFIAAGIIIKLTAFLVFLIIYHFDWDYHSPSQAILSGILGRSCLFVGLYWWGAAGIDTIIWADQAQTNIVQLQEKLIESLKRENASLQREKDMTTLVGLIADKVNGR